jgi:hypothetical protein
VSRALTPNHAPLCAQSDFSNSGVTAVASFASEEVAPAVLSLANQRTFQRFAELMSGEGARCLKLSTRGVWEKKILCVSDESVRLVTSDQQMQIKFAPKSIIWIRDQGKSLAEMDRPGKPIRSTYWSSKPKHGCGGIDFSDVRKVKYEGERASERRVRAETRRKRAAALCSCVLSHDGRMHDLAGSRGGSGGLPPTTPLLARFRRRTLLRRARFSRARLPASTNPSPPQVRRPPPAGVPAQQEGVVAVQVREGAGSERAKRAQRKAASCAAETGSLSECEGGALLRAGGRAQT